MAVRRITDYGAVSGADNNTAAVQAAHTAAVDGDDIHIPSGGYLMRRTTSPWCARITKRVNFTGPGTLIMHPEDAQNAPDPNDDAVTLLYFTASASGMTMRGAHLEGSKLFPNTATAYDPALEHHRAMFFDGTCDVLIEDTDIRNFTGDAAQLYNSCERYVFRRNLFEWQQRDNITLAPYANLTPVRDVLIEYTTLRGAPGQQIDNEHGAAHRVTVRYCLIDAAPFSLESGLGVAIAGAGTDIDGPSTGWDIHDCTILGGVRFTWCSNSKLRNCLITNEMQLPAVELQRGQTDNEITGNTIIQSQTGVIDKAGIFVSGTAGGGADKILLSNNVIKVTSRFAFGIRSDSAHSVTAIGNVLVGSGLTQLGYSGIRARASVVGRPMQSFRAIGNAVVGFGQYGISSVVDAGCQLDVMEVRGNALANLAIGVSVATGAGSLGSCQVAGNTYAASVADQIANVPGGATMSYTLNPARGGVIHSALPVTTESP